MICQDRTERQSVGPVIVKLHSFYGTKKKKKQNPAAFFNEAFCFLHLIHAIWLIFCLEKNKQAGMKPKKKTLLDLDGKIHNNM